MTKKLVLSRLIILTILEIGLLTIGTSSNVNTEDLVVVWDHTFGGTLDDGAFSIIETSDNGYAFCGHTKSLGAGDDDFWLVKLNGDGQEEWNKTFGGSSFDRCLTILQTSDGFILAGHTESFGSGIQDFWLVKTDKNGNQLWNYTYGGPDNEVFRSAALTSDGGIIMTGGSWSFDSNQRIWLIKANSGGSEEWNVSYGVSGSGYRGLSVLETSDKGFAISGGSHLIKTNKTGFQEWNSTLGTKGSDFFNSVIQTNDGGFVFAGGTNLHGAIGDNDVYLLKTNSSGTILWDHTYGGLSWDNAGYDGDVIQTNDNGFLIASQSNSFGEGNGDYWIIKTDAFGVQEYNKTFGGPSQEDARSIIQSSDGSYVIAGFTESKGNGYADAWILKISFEPETITTTKSKTTFGFDLETIIFVVSITFLYSKSRKKL